MHKTFLMSFSDKRDDRRTHGHTDARTHGHTDIHLPPLDKRYSPIISSICGPNNNWFSNPGQVCVNAICGWSAAPPAPPPRQLVLRALLRVTSCGVLHLQHRNQLLHHLASQLLRSGHSWQRLDTLLEFGVVRTASECAVDVCFWCCENLLLFIC